MDGTSPNALICLFKDNIVLVQISMLVNPTFTPYVPLTYSSAMEHTHAINPNKTPPKNFAPFCKSRKYFSVCTPGRTFGILAPIFVMYSATSFGVFCTSMYEPAMQKTNKKT